MRPRGLRSSSTSRRPSSSSTRTRAASRPADDRRGLRARARRRCAVGVRRYRRPQSADRRRDRARAHRDVHRGGRRARSRRRPRRCGRFSATKANLRVVTASFAGLEGARDARSILGAWLVQARDRVDRGGRALARTRRGVTVVTKRGADRGGVAGAAIRLARRGARQVEHCHFYRARCRRSRSAPAR